MKKLLSISLIAILILPCVACTAVAAGGTKTGLGIVTSIGSSIPVAEVEKDGEKTVSNGRAQVDTTICAVTIDENNVVVAISFDVAQTRVAFTPEGEIASDLTAEIQSKRELGDAYNMKRASEAGLELFEQLDNLEAYCLGKTVDEVLAIQTEKRDDAHLEVPADEDLKSIVTITIGEFLRAFEKAVANAK